MKLNWIKKGISKIIQMAFDIIICNNNCYGNLNLKKKSYFWGSVVVPVLILWCHVSGASHLCSSSISFMLYPDFFDVSKDNVAIWREKGRVGWGSEGWECKAI